MRIVFRVLILICIGSHFSRATELYESNLSVRALGMGNAYVSVVDDAYALFYNPARLAAVGGFNFRLMDPYLTVSDPSRIKNVVDSASSTDSLKDTLDPFFGEPAAAGLGTRAAFVMPRFGAALYGDAQIGLNLSNPVLPDLDVRAVTDYGGIAGISLPVAPLIDFGVAIKRVTRQGGEIQISSATVAELDVQKITDEISRKGTAFGMDLGATLSVPGPWDVSASVVWKNVGNMSFKKTGGPSAPPTQKQEMILGVAAGMDFGLAGFTAALDYKHLTNNDAQVGQKVHIGTELNLLMMDIRAGFHQGYFSYGAGVSLGLLDIDFASYGVELGEYPGQLEDRRYAIQITLELGINPFIDIGSGDSKSGKRKGRKARRRGIKQRR